MDKDPQLNISFSTEKPEPVEYRINPACQEMLQSDLLPSEKVTEMINIYIQEHPEFTPPEEELMHPSYLSLFRPIKYWMLKQCGGNTASKVGCKR